MKENSSAIGSLAYSWVTFTNKPPMKPIPVTSIPEKSKGKSYPFILIRIDAISRSKYEKCMHVFRE